MILHIKVKLNSSHNSIEEKQEENVLVVSVKEKPENNKANIALIKLLSKHYNVSPKTIKIKSGLNSRNKLVEIEKRG